ncbi:MAG: PepSY domain-containing protein [Eubacteriales bacterium]
MKKRNIEKRLRQAFSNATPDVLDGVLSKCEEQKGKVIVMPKSKIKNRFTKWTACAAAAIILLAGGLFGVHIYQTNYRVDSVVSLDVNPSIEIQTNQKEQVLAVNALNEDGKIVIGNMNFKGSDLEVTVNALIGSMLRNGYLSEVANSILVSIDGNNTERTAALQQKLVDEINNLLQTDTFSGAVLCQTVSSDDDLKAIAEEYGISKGKAQLINQIVEQNPQYTLEELAALTINELNLLSESENIQLENISSTGSASDKAYIGMESAKEAAYAHAGITADSVITGLEIELDYKHSVMVYEVEFVCGGNEYEYEINATTGEVLEFEKKVKDQKESVADVTVSAETAKAVAFEDAGVKDDSIVTEFEIELDNKNSVMVYKIEFKYDGNEYEYQISATTAEIISSQKEIKDREEQNDNQESSVDSTIGKEAALAIAFGHAGVTADKDASELDIEREYNNGSVTYTVEFIFNGYEYEYEIDAVTGEILNDSKEVRDNRDQSGNQESSADSTIDKEAALAIAFGHAGVTADKDAPVIDIEREYNNGSVTYTVKFIFNGYEYEYEIDGFTGEILNDSKEVRDYRNQSGNQESSADSTIGKEAAKAIAFSHAGVTADKDAPVLDIEREYNNGSVTYTVKFIFNGYEYEYEIDGFTGEILNDSKEVR